MKLVDIISENSWYDDDKDAVSNETRDKFIDAVKNYNMLGKAVYREGNLLESSKTLLKIVKIAEAYTLQEVGDWFDKITVQRNMKDLKTLGGQFHTIALESQQLQDRMAALYEDMGHILNRYYSIDEFQDELEHAQDSRNQLKQEYVSYDHNLSGTDGEAHKDYDEKDIGNAKVAVKNVVNIKKQKLDNQNHRRVKFKKHAYNESIPTKLNLTLDEVGFNVKRMKNAVKNDKFLQMKLHQFGSLKKLWQQYGYGD